MPEIHLGEACNSTTDVCYDNNAVCDNVSSKLICVCKEGFYKNSTDGTCRERKLSLTFTLISTSVGLS